MEAAPVVIFIGVLVFLAHLFVALFERTRIPDVLYLILIGVLIGPVLHIVTPEDFGKIGHVFTTIALIVILFEGGLELKLEQLLTSWRGTIAVTLVCYALAWAALTAASIWILGLYWQLALYLGAVLAGTLLIARILAVRLAITGTALSTKDLSSIGVMIPRGTAAAVLASVPLQLGMDPGAIIRDVAYAVIVISILLTALLIFGLERNPALWPFRMIFPHTTRRGGSKERPVTSITS